MNRYSALAAADNAPRSISTHLSVTALRRNLIVTTVVTRGQTAYSNVACDITTYSAIDGRWVHDGFEDSTRMVAEQAPCWREWLSIDCARCLTADGARSWQNP